MYTACEAFLFSLKKSSLIDCDSPKRMASFLKSMGNPQSSFPSIHIAGTNGKGSVSSILSNIYEASDYKVGLFTSPHLISLCERIQINHQPIPEDRLEALVAHIRSTCVALSFFEFMTTLAFLYFAEEKVDIAIIETGIGGRLDATVVLDPIASVITTISYDHQELLGDTLEAIAYEKGGIIKPNTPVFFGELPQEALSVVKKIADIRKAPFCLLDDSFLQQVSNDCLMLHQKRNAALALCVASHLKDKLGCDMNKVRQADLLPRLAGRLQSFVLPSGLKVVLDGAHNEESARILKNFVQKEKEGLKKIGLVFACSSLRRAKIVLGELLPEISAVFLPEASSLGLLSLSDIYPVVCGLGAREVYSYKLSDLPMLWESQMLAMGLDTILVAGSFYIVGDVLKSLRLIDL